MPILSWFTQVTGLAGITPSVIYILTNDNLSTVLTTGYLNEYVMDGLTVTEDNMALVTTKDNGPVWLQIEISGPNYSLVEVPGSSVSVSGTASQILVNGGLGPVSSPVTISMPAAVVVSTSLQAGDLKLIGNGLRATNTDGDVIITPDGAGAVQSQGPFSVNAGNNFYLFNTGSAAYCGFVSPASPSNTIWSLPSTAGTVGQVIGLTGTDALGFIDSGTVSSGTQNDLAYYAATGSTVSGLATANNGVLVTSSGGVPSIGSTLPSAVQANITGVGTLTSGALGSGFTTVAVAQGGTGVTSVTTAPTATAFAGWDSHSNLSANNFLAGYATTATAAGTTTLTVSSAKLQYFTGSTTQTVVMPVTSTLVLGQQFSIVNNSSGVVTVQSSGANTIQAMAANTVLTLTCISTSGTSASSWNALYSPNTVTSGVPSITGTSGSVLVNGGTSPVTTAATLTFDANCTITESLNVGYLQLSNSGAPSATIQANTVPLVLYASASGTDLSCYVTNNRNFILRSVNFGDRSPNLKILCPDQIHSYGFKSPPVSFGADSLYILPETPGADHAIMQSDTTGQMSWLATGSSAVLVCDASGVSSYVNLPGTQTVVGVNGGAPVAASIPGRNMILNGDMQVAQRGAGGSASFSVPASTTQYTLDRWQVLTNANQACTIAQSAGATSGSFLATIQRNSGQTGTGVIRFCTSLTRGMSLGSAGNKITISFKAKKGADFSSAASALTVTVYSGTGSTDISGINGAFTGNASAISQTATLSTSLTSYSYTSSALGSNVTQLAVEFSYTPVGTASTNDSFSVTDVQLEISPNPTPYQRVPFFQALLNCQAFYWKSFAYGTAPAQNVGASTGELLFSASNVGATSILGSTILYPTQMIASVAPTIYNPAASNAQMRDETAGVDCSSSSGYNYSASGFTPNCLGNASTVVGNIIGYHATTDADLT